MLLRIPAPFDPHVHLRDLDWSHKGTVASETAAALAGGYTALLDMPNTPPATTNPAALNRKGERFLESARCDWGLWFGAAQPGNEEHFDRVQHLVCGLKIYNNETTGDLLIEDQAMRDRIIAAWPAGVPIAVHAEEDTVDDILQLVRRHRKYVHFCHISSAFELKLLAGAREEGLPVSIGVCPHHLFLTRDDLAALGPLGLMKPELKTSADRDALRRALRSGLVDFVESDHAPHTLAEKYGEEPAHGVPGLETTLPLLGQAVHEGWLEPGRLVELVSTAPRRLFGYPLPPDSWTELDLGESQVIEDNNLRTHCGWSPFSGMRVHGVVRQLTLRGRQVFDGEQVLAAPGDGLPLTQRNPRVDA
ncbi:MAG: amidohydrolase family protein [Anaerolineaceae bacterium]|nr:amidohydrolase family protein [Anaerolineaceae bacterium]